MKVIISSKAQNDTTEIYEYIAKDSLKYANITLEKLYYYINFLEFSPYLGRYVPELQDKHYREILYKSYRIVYSIFKETIYIHFIIHSKRNFSSFYSSYIKD